MSANSTTSSPRARLVDQRSDQAEVAATVGRLIGMSVRALPHMYRSSRHEFARTVRRDDTAKGGLRQEGASLRYTAIVALGAACTDLSSQRKLLAAITARELIDSIAKRALNAKDLGTAALSGWAAAEILHDVPAALFVRLVREVKKSAPQPTVDYAWTLTALVAAHRLEDFSTVAQQAAARLMSAQEASGLFPHALPRRSLGRYRAHVASYADQVYPIQALARYFALTGDRSALDAADRCAARIVMLQGAAGQWWWHYDVRTGAVVEGYPVYSVHQHAMGPMALFDLYEAGGTDYRSAIVAGLSWLHSHPEVDAELLDDPTGVVWRKVYRHEPRKLVRSLRSVATAPFPRLKLGLLDRVCPTGLIDYGCHSYELGWLLYAWKAGSVVSSLSKGLNVRPVPEDG